MIFKIFILILCFLEKSKSVKLYYYGSYQNPSFNDHTFYDEEFEYIPVPKPKPMTLSKKFTTDNLIPFTKKKCDRFTSYGGIYHKPCDFNLRQNEEKPRLFRNFVLQKVRPKRKPMIHAKIIPYPITVDEKGNPKNVYNLDVTRDEFAMDYIDDFFRSSSATEDTLTENDLECTILKIMNRATENCAKRFRRNAIFRADSDEFSSSSDDDKKRKSKGKRFRIVANDQHIKTPDIVSSESATNEVGTDIEDNYLTIEPQKKNKKEKLYKIPSDSDESEENNIKYKDATDIDKESQEYKPKKQKKYKNIASPTESDVSMPNSFENSLSAKEKSSSEEELKEEFVIVQGHRWINDLRKRFQQFLPKRIHWTENDLKDLSYFWFDGPQGS